MNRTFAVLLSIAVFGLYDMAAAINVPPCGCCQAPDPNNQNNCLDVQSFSISPSTATYICAGGSQSFTLTTTPSGGCVKWSVMPKNADPNFDGCDTGRTFKAAAGFTGKATIKAECGCCPPVTVDVTVVKVTIVAPSDLYTYCGVPTPSPVINASLTPSVSGASFVWFVTKGSAKVSIADPTAQFTAITPTGPSNASAVDDDVELRVFVTLPGGAGCDAFKTLTVRRPDAIIFYNDELDPTPPPGIPILWYVDYSIFDQLCRIMPASKVNGLIADETFANSTCLITQGPGPVGWRVSGKISDKVGLTISVPTCYYEQTISCDCASRSQNVDADAGTGVTPTYTGGPNCP